MITSGETYINDLNHGFKDRGLGEYNKFMDTPGFFAMLDGEIGELSCLEGSIRLRQRVCLPPRCFALRTRNHKNKDDKCL